MKTTEIKERFSQSIKGLIDAIESDDTTPHLEELVRFNNLEVV